MTKSSILDWDTVAANNTDIGGIDIGEGCPASNLNNGQREAMAQIKAGVDYKTIASTKGANYTAVLNDNNALLRFSGAYTLSLTAAATLGANWHVLVVADGGDVVIDPNSSETINGATTITIPDGYSAFIWCTGSAFLATKEYTTIPTALAAKQTAVQNWEDVASDTTTDIGAATSQNVRITGSATITGLGTATAGTFRRCRFAASLTLTHNGTSLILTGGVTRLTAAGDIAEFISEGSGNWRCLDYRRAAGKMPILHVRDQKAGSTAGGSSTGGTQVRTLNTEITNTIPGASLASDLVTLPRGEYDVIGRAPGLSVNAHKAWLRVSGGGTTLLEGSSEFSTSGQGVQTASHISGRLSLSSETEIELAHFTQSANATNGLGAAAGAGSTNEVYSELVFRKVD